MITIYIAALACIICGILMMIMGRGFPLWGFIVFLLGSVSWMFIPLAMGQPGLLTPSIISIWVVCLWLQNRSPDEDLSFPCGDIHTELLMAQARILELEALINTPRTDEFFDAVRFEAAHQVERWGVNHDRGKEPHDWFWLLGYLSGKALAAFTLGNPDKGLHHIISSSAMLLNWYRHVTGENSRMSPGIEEPSHD